MLALSCGAQLEMWHAMCHNTRMPTVNARQLRNTRKLKAWLRAGKTVVLQERNKVIAHIVPATEQGASGELPDFAARRKNIFGDRVLLGAEVLIEERGRY